MAKIVTPRLPEATEEYSREQISQLCRGTNIRASYLC